MQVLHRRTSTAITHVRDLEAKKVVHAAKMCRRASCQGASGADAVRLGRWRAGELRPRNRRQRRAGQTLYKKPLYNTVTDFTPVILIADALAERRAMPLLKRQLLR